MIVNQMAPPLTGFMGFVFLSRYGTEVQNSIFGLLLSIYLLFFIGPALSLGELCGLNVSRFLGSD